MRSIKPSGFKEFTNDSNISLCVDVWVCSNVHLCSADPDDPGWRDDDSSMSPQRAAFLNLLQHETCHLVVILKHKNKINYLVG